MSNTKKNRYVIYIEFMQPQNPEHIENQIRYSIDKKIIPPIRELMVGIDHKNMRQMSVADLPLPLVITDVSDLKEG